MYKEGLNLSEENEEAINNIIDQQAIHYLNIKEEKHHQLIIYKKPVKTPFDVEQEAIKIMRKQQNAFSIQIQLSYILKEISTGKYFLFYAAENTNFFSIAQKVKKRRN